MTQISVRALTADEWTAYRDIRLASLKASPEAFAATYEDESGLDDAVWQDRMARSTRLVAEKGAQDVGVASVRVIPSREGADDNFAEFFGLWVRPELRGSGIAMKLMQAATSMARQLGARHLVYWVGTDNGPAVAFASSYGFRPADSRRPMKNERGEVKDGEEELMMKFPLDADPGTVASTALR